MPNRSSEDARSHDRCAAARRAVCGLGALAALISAFAAGCDSPALPDGAGGAATAASGGGGAADVGGAASGGGGAAGHEAQWADVIAYRIKADGGLVTYVGARFTRASYATTPAPPPDQCENVFVGYCHRRVCAPLDPPPTEMPVISYPRAGAIDFSGPSFAITLTQPSDAELEQNGGWTDDDSSDERWVSGDTISMTVDGDEVHAFGATLVAPFAPALLEPSTFTGLVIDRSTPFVVRWEAAPSDAPGSLHVSLDQIECDAPLDVGELAIDPALLSALAPWPSTELTIWSESRQAADVSGWSTTMLVFELLPMSNASEISSGEVAVE
jgi:hypothetical protein